MGKYWKITALFIIIAVASFLRFYDLKSAPPGLYPDEAMNGSNVLEALSKNPPEFKVFYPENNGREGLFINIQGIFLKYLMPASGLPQPWMLKIPSALFGILTVLGVYFLSKELFRKEKVALLAAFFIATGFWHINFSRIGFRAIMAPFFLAWGLYFIVKALRKNSALEAAIAGVFYGLGFHSYIAYRATPLIILVVFVIAGFRMGWKKMLKIGAIFSAVTIIVAAPLLIYFAQNPQDFLGRTTQISVFSSPTPVKDFALNIVKTIGMFNVVGDFNWRHNVSGRPELFIPVGILFLIGLIHSLKLFFKGFPKYGDENSFAALVVIAWFAVAAAPVVISNEGIPHALRAILMAPAAYILAGLGAWLAYEWLESKKLPKKMLKLAYVIFFFILVIEAYTSYFVTWAENDKTAEAFAKNYVDIANSLNVLSNDLPKYVLVEAGGTDVRGLPMPTQTVMFLTATFLPEEQAKKNIHYVLVKDAGMIPPGSFVVSIK
jgi:4-amino-4-deoxy-L-arabinose transferase-like glycosyltransferase